MNITCKILKQISNLLKMTLFTSMIISYWRSFLIVQFYDYQEDLKFEKNYI